MPLLPESATQLRRKNRSRTWAPQADGDRRSLRTRKDARSGRGDEVAHDVLWRRAVNERTLRRERAGYRYTVDGRNDIAKAYSGPPAGQRIDDAGHDNLAVKILTRPWHRAAVQLVGKEP